MFYNKLVLCVVLASGSLFGMNMEQAKAKMKADVLIEKYCNKKRKNPCEEKDILIYISDKPKIAIDQLLVQEFITRGIDLNAKDNDGWTALAAAAWVDNQSLCRLFVECGADAEIAFQKILVQHSLFSGIINRSMLFCGRVCLNTYRKPLLMAYLLSLQRLGIHLPAETHGAILSHCPAIVPSYCFWKLYSEQEIDRFFDFHNEEVIALLKEFTEWPK